jgi:hypothetical protein
LAEVARRLGVLAHKDGQSVIEEWDLLAILQTLLHWYTSPSLQTKDTNHPYSNFTSMLTKIDNALPKAKHSTVDLSQVHDNLNDWINICQDRSQIQFNRKHFPAPSYNIGQYGKSLKDSEND